MNKIKITVRAFALLVTVICTALFVAVFAAYYQTSSQYNVVSGEKLVIDCNIPLVVKSKNDEIAFKKADFENRSYDVELSLLGIIPLRHSTVNVVEEGKVCVMGTPFGMKVYTDGVLVVNLSDVDTENGNKSPAKSAGLKINDSIITIDNEKVYTNDDVAEIIEKSGGRPLELVIKRENQIKILKITPEKSKSSRTYKAGIWVRDSSAGIGTLTFYMPGDRVICGLGHGVSDNDTGKILPISSGEIVKAEIISLTKAQKGTPGELRGRLLGEKYGDMSLNCENGVYGITKGDISGGQVMSVALKQEIKDGQATIFTSVDGVTPKNYNCEISVNRTDSDRADIVLKITDKELLEKTGGIVQGMSGSPILQNGRLIGAITHVLVDDPTTGYAIFAENMLETAQSVANSEKLRDAS